MKNPFDSLRNSLTRREFLRDTSLATAGLGVILRPVGSDSISHMLSLSSVSAVEEQPPARRGLPLLVSFRILPCHWEAEDRFEQFLGFLRRYPDTADEVAFFTSNTHPPVPLGELQRRIDMLAKRMEAVRREGVTAGIELLAAIGHHEENLEGALDQNWQRVMDPQGQISRGSYCPADPGILGYIEKVYTLQAQASPDFLWVGDDVRLAGHMPVVFTCFCDRCVKDFSVQVHRDFTRASLVKAFDSGTLEERLELRQQWLNHNRAMLDNLFRLVEQTVHKVKPDLPLGFMTGDRFFEGYDFANWAKTLAGPAQVPVRWRPGGGFYSDERLVGLVEKAHDMGRQVSQLPPTVEVIQSEVENFPYNLLSKSAETTVLEAAAEMAAGTTVSAFNVFGQRPDPIDEYLPVLRRIRLARNFYQVLHDELGRSPVVGVWPAWNRDLFIANNIDRRWLEGGDAIATLQRAYVLSEIGIPVCYGPEQAVATVFAGPAVHAFSEVELRRMFSGGVLMDVTVWEALNRRGLASWTGVRLGKRRERDAIEYLTNHPINGKFANWSRDCRQSFWHEAAYSLEPQAAGGGTLAQMRDYLDRDLGASMTAFENELGGRVVVMGYFPWSQMHNLGKSSQMKAVCEWLSRGRMPVKLESFARIHLWVRQSGPGRMAVVLLNGSLDPQEGVTLRLREQFQQLQWTTFAGEKVRLKAEAAGEAKEYLVHTPPLKPWGIYLLSVRA